MRQLKALMVLALALTVMVPVAYAETQNVKVSGSIDGYWFYRRNFDLSKDNGQQVTATDNTGAPATDRSPGDDYFRTNTQIEVSADLTDNVSTVINVINQRDWQQDTAGDGLNSVLNDAAEFDIDLDLAYVQMKEIFYSPLTLTVGRQDLWFGRGFIIGSNHTAWDFNASTKADEYSVSTAFDAIRATLDFNPWTIDGVYSKITEGFRDTEDDTDLYILNINYKFSEYNAVAEGYWVTEYDRSSANATDAQGGTTPANSTYTLGGRAQFDPISQITLGGELAYQFGTYHNNASSVEKDRHAWAADVFGTYRWDNAWKPEVTVEYVYFSGETDLSNSNSSYDSWNFLYRGRFYTAYEDFREFLYGTDQAGDTPATQNSEMIQVKGAIKPLEDLLLEGTVSYFWSPEDDHTTITNPNSTVLDGDIGWEIDVQTTYDYTEDVSFGVLAAWFIPGDKFSGAEGETATDLVSSVKVTF